MVSNQERVIGRAYCIVKSGSIVDMFKAKNPWILMTILNLCSLPVDNKGVIFDKYVTNLTSTTLALKSELDELKQELVREN